MSWGHDANRGIILQGGPGPTGGLGFGATGVGTAISNAQAAIGTGTSWNHVAYVRDASSTIAYVNGVQVASNSHTSVPIINMPSWGVLIGSDPIGRPFHGCIDEVKVFNTALSAADVVRYGFNAGDKVMHQGELVGWVAQ